MRDRPIRIFKSVDLEEPPIAPHGLHCSESLSHRLDSPRRSRRLFQRRIHCALCGQPKYYHEIDDDAPATRPLCVRCYIIETREID
jgi:hypothetical protein